MFSSALTVKRQLFLSDQMLLFCVFVYIRRFVINKLRRPCDHSESTFCPGFRLKFALQNRRDFATFVVLTLNLSN